MKLDFKQWMKKLDEVGTATNSIAVFSRPFGPIVRRKWFGGWADEDPFFKKKKQQNKQN